MKMEERLDVKRVAGYGTLLSDCVIQNKEKESHMMFGSHLHEEALSLTLDLR